MTDQLSADDLAWLAEQEGGGKPLPPPAPVPEPEPAPVEEALETVPYGAQQAKEDFAWFKRKEWRKVSHYSRRRLAAVEEWINAQIAQDLI